VIEGILLSLIAATGMAATAVLARIGMRSIKSTTGTLGSSLVIFGVIMVALGTL